MLYNKPIYLKKAALMDINVLGKRNTRERLGLKDIPIFIRYCALRGLDNN